MQLVDILSDLVDIDDVLFVVKSSGATSEIRSNGLGVVQRGKWITVGDNDGPCHMHVNSEAIRRAEFVTEQKPERTSFSVRFFDEGGERLLAGFFTRMYDQDMNLIGERKRLYDALLAKHGQKTTFSQS